jgi:hypothetical protein
LQFYSHLVRIQDDFLHEPHVEEEVTLDIMTTRDNSQLHAHTSQPLQHPAQWPDTCYWLYKLVL